MFGAVDVGQPNGLTAGSTPRRPRNRYRHMGTTWRPARRNSDPFAASKGKGEDAPVETPQGKYAWNGDVALAYQVVGDGPIDLVWVSGFEAHLDMRWENPDLASFLRRLAARTRLIITDRRGFGLSDRFAPHDIPPLETLADDLLAVMDAADSERAAILAAWQGGFMGTVLAATHPERVAALILLGAFPTYSATEETPWLPTESDWASGAERMRADWARPMIRELEFRGCTAVGGYRARDGGRVGVRADG